MSTEITSFRFSTLTEIAAFRFSTNTTIDGYRFSTLTPIADFRFNFDKDELVTGIGVWKVGSTFIVQ